MKMDAANSFESSKKLSTIHGIKNTKETAILTTIVREDLKSCINDRINYITYIRIKITKH